MKLVYSFLFLFILTSSSYSQEWVRQNPFAKLSQMYDIHFDGRYGLAVGADSTIFTTTNYGSTWVSRKASIYARTIESAFVVPGTMGQVMLAGGDSILMMTENGGVLWKT
ncbi:MAG: YCF48-related protein [Saprospiraceae bacterium]